MATASATASSAFSHTFSHTFPHMVSNPSPSQPINMPPMSLPPSVHSQMAPVSFSGTPTSPDLFPSILSSAQLIPGAPRNPDSPERPLFGSSRSFDSSGSGRGSFEVRALRDGERSFRVVRGGSGSSPGGAAHLSPVLGGSYNPSPQSRSPQLRPQQQPESPQRLPPSIALESLPAGHTGLAPGLSGRNIQRARSANGWYGGGSPVRVQS